MFSCFSRLGAAGADTEKLILLLNDTTAIIFALIVMFHLNVPLAILAVGLLPLYYVNYRYFTKHLKTNTEQFRFYRDQVSNSLQERLAAHELIQTFALEELQQQQFSEMAKQVRDASLKGAAYDITYDQLTKFLRKIGNSCIYCAGCYFFLKGDSEIKFIFRYFALDFGLIREIFSIGSITLARQGSISLLIVVLNQSLYTYAGEIGITVYGIVNRVMMFALFPIIGIVQGILKIHVGASPTRTVMITRGIIIYVYDLPRDRN